jgi:hypothetical protein
VRSEATAARAWAHAGAVRTSARMVTTAGGRPRGMTHQGTSTGAPRRESLTPRRL